MKLILIKDSLIEALNSVEKSIGSGDNLPILKNLKIEANKNNSVILTTTDLEIAIEHNISGKVIEKGSVVVPFSLFSNVISNLNSEKIQINIKDNKLLLKTDNYDASFLCENINDYPIIPDVSDKSKKVTLKTDILHKSFYRSIIATQHSDIRQEINGVFVNYDNNNIFTVGTDSFRLVENKINKNNINSDYKEINITIPIKTVDSFLKIFNKDNNEDINIFFDDNQIVFKSDNIKIISRLIEGKFPDYKNIIPKDLKQEITIKKQELLNAIKTTKSFSGQTNDIVFDCKNDKIMEIYSSDSSTGENVYRLPINIQGDFNNFSITFNWKYILDGLKVFDSDDIIIGISEPEKPVIIKSSKNKEVIYIVMPIKS